MRSKHWKQDRLCPVCGVTFKGTAKAQVCGSTCRSRLRRLIEANKKPEFYLIAKSKGQKVPLLFKPPKPVETKKEIPIPETSIPFVNPTPEVFDSERLPPNIQDEPPKTQPPLTIEQILKLKEDLKEEIEFWKTRPCQGHPRMWNEKKEAAIKELQDKINQLK